MRSVIAQVIMLALWSAHAQTASGRLTFEVASIKPSAPDVQGLYVPARPADGLRMTGATLKNLIGYAYNVREFLIFGGPAWVNSDRFDVNARAGASSENSSTRSSGRQMLERLQSLLADRFQLAIHRESKEQSVYVLVVAKNGPNVHEAKPDTRTFIRRWRSSITGQGVRINMLVLNLSNTLEHPILDRTGLTGKYDFKLEWADTAEAPPDLNGPSLFTALQEQLGLRLESQKAPVETLVIDHAERPSDN